MKLRKPIPRKRKTPRRSKRILDEKYLAWLRGLPCWACVHGHGGGQQSPTESAHIGLSTSRRGLGQKFSDTEAIPLCEGHHTGRWSIHALGPVRFFEHNAADRDATIRRYQEMYKEQND